MHLKPEELFLIQALVLIGLPYILWRFLGVKRFMPLVVMQILLGIALGPSIMGRLNPELFETLVPAGSIPLLSGLSLMAILLFGFQTGLHFDTSEIRGKGKAFATTSLSSILIPSVLGFGLAWLVSGQYAELFLGEKATLFTFSLGVGIAIGVTALPVLGAILIDMKKIDKPIGRLALGYATVNDGTLWILVSVLLALVGQGEHASFAGVAKTICLTFAYLAAMIFGVRPLLQKLADSGKLTNAGHGQHHSEDKISRTSVVLLICAMLLSAIATEFIGIHYLLGAFVFGAVVPKVRNIAHDIHHEIDPVLSVALLPFFFMLTGLKTKFDLASAPIWYFFAAATAVSAFGKVAGTALPERFLNGSNWRKALELGGFMQCKGLMEVIVLNMLLAGGVITATSFSALILMAVATTAATKPFVLLANHLLRHRFPEAEEEQGRTAQSLSAETALS